MTDIHNKEEHFDYKDQYILGISFSINSKNDIKENILKRENIYMKI
jgi:hypothetical protein